MIKLKHTKNGKVKEEHRSKYNSREIEEFETKEPTTQLEALILIWRELIKLNKKL